MKRLQSFHQNWQAKRQKDRVLNKKFNALTDPTFMDRALRGLNMTDEAIHAGYVKIHDRIYKKMSRLGKWWHRHFCKESHNA